MIRWRWKSKSVTVWMPIYDFYKPWCWGCSVSPYYTCTCLEEWIETVKLNFKTPKEHQVVVFK